MLTPVLLFACAAVALAAIGAPMADSALNGRISNSTNTATTAGYFTCSAAVSDTKPGAGAAYFAYPFAEGSGTTAADVAGSNHTGTYTTRGITYGVADSTVCPRDNKTVITLNGTTGYVSGPNTAATAPNVFSLEIWFKTTTSQGMLIGFGTSRTGSSLSSDRDLYINTTGNLVFGVNPGTTRTITSPSTVTNGVWHYAAATLSGAGMALYLDGNRVATNTSTTTGQGNVGYWRIGYDNLAAWPGSGSNYFIAGSIAWAAEYGYALTAAQITGHYQAGV